MDAPPPTEVFCEFDKAHVDVFIQMADVLEDAFPTVMVSEKEDNEPREGSFEVTHEDGTELFSKLKVGKIPRLEDVLEALEQKMVADGKNPFAGEQGGGAC